MKTCATIAPAEPRCPSPYPPDDPAAVGLGPKADDGPRVVFACPCCASRLSVPKAAGAVAGACPVCQAGVVAPQPEFGCHAMPYRDWLRLQEMEWPVPDRPAPPAPRRPPEPPSRQLPAAAPVTAGTRVPCDFLSSARRAGVAVAAMLIAGVWVGTRGGKPSESSIGPNRIASADPPARNAPATAPVAPAPASAAETEDTTSPSETVLTPPEPPVPAPVPPLAAVLNRQAPEGSVVVVRATRAHSFSRSAPPEEAFWCLKLTDETDASVTTRAYLPLTLPATATAPAALAWGRDQRVALRLRWMEPDAATGVAGHWRITSLDDATLSLSSVQ